MKMYIDISESDLNSLLIACNQLYYDNLLYEYNCLDSLIRKIFYQRLKINIKKEKNKK